MTDTRNLVTGRQGRISCGDRVIHSSYGAPHPHSLPGAIRTCSPAPGSLNFIPRSDRSTRSRLSKHPHLPRSSSSHGSRIQRRGVLLSRRPVEPEAGERAAGQDRGQRRRPRLDAQGRPARQAQLLLGLPLVRPRPSQVPGPLLRRDPGLPHRRVPGRLRLGQRWPVGGPGEIRQEQGAGGDPRAVGDAGHTGHAVPGGAGEQRGEVRGGGVVQGGGADLPGGRAGLPRQPGAGARAEHSGHLGGAGDPHGRRGGLPRRGRAAGRCRRPALPGRELRPAGPGGRPRGLRRAQGEGDQERQAGHVLRLRLLRAGHRHREGPSGQPLGPRRRPRRQQRLGLRHQLRPRRLGPSILPSIRNSATLCECGGGEHAWWSLGDVSSRLGVFSSWS